MMLLARTAESWSAIKSDFQSVEVACAGNRKKSTEKKRYAKK